MLLARDKEQLRRELNDVISRGRHRPTAQQLLKYSHAVPIEAPQPCDQDNLAACDDVQWERVSLNLHDESDPSQTTLKVILAKSRNVSASAQLPVVCVLHSTSSNCETEEMLLTKARLAQKGFLAVGINSRYHGCRLGHGFEGKQRYLKELLHAWKRNSFIRPEENLYPFIYDTAADLRSVADYLVSRPDADGTRLGITGKSLGGMHAWFAAAADARWTAVAPLIGVQSFSYAVQNECFHARVGTIQDVFDAAAREMGEESVTSDVVRTVWNKICPGLLEKFDAATSLSLLSPRPVFIGNGELDPRCPVQGVQDAVRVAREFYQRDCGQPGRLELHIYKAVAHKVTAEMWADCLHFFERVFLDIEKQPSTLVFAADVAELV